MGKVLQVWQAWLHPASSMFPVGTAADSQPGYWWVSTTSWSWLPRTASQPGPKQDNMLWQLLLGPALQQNRGGTAAGQCQGRWFIWPSNAIYLKWERWLLCAILSHAMYRPCFVIFIQMPGAWGVRWIEIASSDTSCQPEPSWPHSVHRSRPRSGVAEPQRVKENFDQARGSGKLGWFDKELLQFL